MFPVLNAVFIVNGSMGGPYATGISIAGLTVTETRVTYLEQFEVRALRKSHPSLSLALPISVPIYLIVLAAGALGR